MDLTVEQSTQIKEYIDRWLKDPRLELETTFGQGGVTDANTFLQIAQRLRAKGFRPHAQEDHLNIITPKHIRYTLEGLGILQAYCKEDSLEKRPFTAMFKDRAFPESNLDLPEYQMRVKIRREEELSREDPRITEMLKQWKRQKKAFRWIRRWSFEGKGVRVDLSMVRQTPTLPDRGEFQWATTFLEKNVLQEVPRYEVEVELVRGEDTETAALALKALISGIGEVLRAIQKNSLLLRQSVAKQVRQEYQELVGGPKFRGVGPVTLETKNITSEIQDGVVNIRTGFNVTDKADGLRTMGFVNAKGELYLVDQSLNVYRTGLQNKACARSLVDGEWVTQTKEGRAIHHFLLFDIYYAAEGERVSSLPFSTFKEGVLDSEGESRYLHLKRWFATWSKDTEVVARGVTDANRLVIAVKEFFFASPGDSIFTQGCVAVLDTPRIYHTDGLILTSHSEPLPDGLGVRFEHQFKWKPSKDNTVDFLVSFEKDPQVRTMDKIDSTLNAEQGLLLQYKTARLYVGGKKSKEEANPRDTILQQTLVVKAKEDEGPVRYRPVLFHPVDYTDTMANTCYLPMTVDPETLEEYVMTETKEPIRNHSVVEMRYDPSREPGWRWIPTRIRHDKTERLLRAQAQAKDGNIKYSGIMNDESVANSVWSSIHDPVTLSMIRSGREEPTAEEMKAMMPAESKEEKDEAGGGAGIGVKYYERKAPKENMALIKGLQDFHNKYIKNELLLKRALLGFNKSIVDLACGKAGDLYKWIQHHARRVVGIDTAADNITNSVDGAYRRYMDVIREGKRKQLPRMAFVVGDSSKSLVDGSAGSTPEDKDILRTIFGRAETEGPVPSYITQHFSGALRDGADVAACMFALHYFFQSKETVDGFLNNLSQTVKVGGYFVGCCFDGQSIFQLLQGLSRGQSKTGTEKDVPIWTITKEYEADHLTEDDTSIGLPIKVGFLSIGMTHTEYLVPFELLRLKLADLGFRLLDREELGQLNLEHSTNTFDRSYEMLHRGGAKTKYYMPDAVKEFSFLNRWFIFKRAGTSRAELVAAPPNVEAAAAAAVAENRHFDIGLTKYNETYKLFSIVSSSPYSVLKPWEKTQVNLVLRKWFPVADSVRRIVDATAHIGVDTINFSNQFKKALIDAYEIVPETYEALVKNIAKFKKQDRIRPHNEDISQWEPSHITDFLYVDPPWGGKSYAEKESLDLYLQKEENAHNESKNVNVLIDKWFQSGKIRNILLKAPKNFNKSHLAGRYTLQEEQILNQRKKDIAYLLIRIQAPVAVSEEAAEEQEEPVAVVEEKKEEKDLMARLTDPSRTFKESEVFVFGSQVALRDSLKWKGSETVPKERAGRWLSFSAPFPHPDRDLKAEDGQAIVYPTMEHYLAAMKYQHASNRPDLAITLFSTVGNIHQRYLIKRRAKGVRLGVGTPEDDKMLEEEVKEVKERLAPAFMEKQRVVIQEDKWNRPIHPDDPLPMRDRILRDALSYRWERDAAFRSIVEEARKKEKYLLYSIGADSDSSEWAGKLEISGPFKGKIRGGNKVGLFLMEIAGYA